MWTVRNVQIFNEPVPICDSTFLHLWIGNNPLADGTELDENRLQESLLTHEKGFQPPLILLKEAEKEAKQLKEGNYQQLRYNMLMSYVAEEVRDNPRKTCNRRIQSILAFLLGGDYLYNGQKNADKVEKESGQGPIAELPEWLDDEYVKISLSASLLAMLCLSLLGWRWSMGWRQEARLASLAMIWLPLPYILSHAERLSGPRLPLDGVLLCFAAFALIGTAVNAPPKTNGDKKKKYA